MEENKNPAAGGSDPLRRVYDDTTYFIDSIVQDYGVFPAILGRMQEGDATIELKKRYLLRAIDETWVNIIEDTLPALDVIIRNPSKFIEEREEVLPIEFSRNISVRSLQHLSQHTNLISKIEGDKVTPSKILNVFREETIQTYENKFINTLINRLFSFVNRRYEIAKTAGQDEKTTSLEFKENFRHDDVKVKMLFRMEIAESAEKEEDRVERNYTYTTDLWRRVERLNGIVTAYTTSEFVQNMGHSYIRPPVIRTNAILKNKNLRQCLALWQFIESYDDAGYSMLVQEDLERVDDEFVKELYSTLALQYLIFRYNIHNEFDAENTLASQMTEGVLSPRIISEPTEVSAREFDVPVAEERTPENPGKTRCGTLTPEDQLMLTTLDVALDAADVVAEQEREMPIRGDIPEPEPTPEVVEPEPEPEPESEPEPEPEVETASEPAPEAEAAPSRPEPEKTARVRTQPRKIAVAAAPSVRLKRKMVSPARRKVNAAYGK